jgi:hypothetical protein
MFCNKSVCRSGHNRRNWVSPPLVVCTVTGESACALLTRRWSRLSQSMPKKSPGQKMFSSRSPPSSVGALSFTIP